MWTRDGCLPVSPWAMGRPGSSSDQNRSCGPGLNASPRADQNRSCGGGPGTRREWPPKNADLHQDRSCGGSRAQSPASSAGTVRTCAPGDSEESTDEGHDSETKKEGARYRRVRRVPVAAVAGEPTYTGPRSTRHNNRFDVGNVGVFFANWGNRTKKDDGKVQNNIDAQILKNPCQVIGLAECQKETQDLLHDPAAAAAKLSQSAALEHRGAYPYFTIRPAEPVTLLLGVRSAVADSIQTLDYTKKEEGMYRGKSSAKNKMRAYTRTLTGQINMKTNIGYIGKALRVAVCHLHFQVGNNNRGFKKQHNEFWGWLANHLNHYAVHVLIGDFNMSLFKVVPELRSRGIEANLVSWFPWRSEETDTAMADSCGIFFVVRCDVSPSVNPDIWDPEVWAKLPVFSERAGPGQPISTYLPKDGELRKKILDSLQPLPMTIKEGDESVEDASSVAGKVKDGLSVKAKILQVEVFKYEGENHKGSHFPLAAWTKGADSRRSEQAYCDRQKKGRARMLRNRPK